MAKKSGCFFGCLQKQEAVSDTSSPASAQGELASPGPGSRTGWRHSGFCCLQKQEAVSDTSSPASAQSELASPGPRRRTNYRASGVVPLEYDGEFKQHIKLGRLLDTGGYSDVHLGKMLATREVVAVKKIHAKNKKLDAVGIVSQEVSALKKLQHGNIIQLVGVYSMKKNVALVFELMQISLWHLLHGTHISLGETLELAVLHEVLQGLAFMHDQGMMHGDIKPHNILVGVKETVAVKIADFGSCGETGTTLARPRGTTVFLSPEALECWCDRRVTQELDTARDIWALGISMLMVATGRIPFYGLSAKKLVRAHRELSEFPLQEELAYKKTERSAEWQALISGCLAKAPEQRTSSQTLLQLDVFKERGDLDQLRPFVSDVLSRQTTRHEVIVLF